MELVSALGDWNSAAGPLHRKLLAGLRGAIESGALAAGSRLPSERAFARDLVVSRSTVVAAYDGLRAAGLAESRHGSGTYVVRVARRHPRLDADPVTPGTPIFRRLLAGTEDGDRLISLACATVPGPVAIGEAMTSYPGEDLAALLGDTGYLPRGLPALRQALGRLVTASGLETEADDILVTTGAHQAITLCASLFVHPGDVVVVENPTYPGCADAFAAAGARFVSLPVDGDGLVLDDLERLLRRMPVAAIYVMPTFQNPTGAMMAPHRRRALADLAGRTGVPVIEDNALAHAGLGGPLPPPPVAAYPGADRAPVISVGSLSKVLWGGLRVGWLRAPQPWLDRFARRKVAADLGSGLLDQAVAARLLERLPELDAENTRLLLERLDGAEALLAHHLPDWSWTRPTGGPSLWVRLPNGDAERFAQVALRHGVEIVPGSGFGMGGSFNDHLRLPFTCEPSVMAEAVRRLAEAWRTYGPDAGGHEPFNELRLVV
jgi:DNA-binding transcriptional MocR family regulator